MLLILFPVTTTSTTKRTTQSTPAQVPPRRPAPLPTNRPRERPPLAAVVPTSKSTSTSTVVSKNVANHAVTHAFILLRVHPLLQRCPADQAHLHRVNHHRLHLLLQINQRCPADPASKRPRATAPERPWPCPPNPNQPPRSSLLDAIP